MTTVASDNFGGEGGGSGGTGGRVGKGRSKGIGRRVWQVPLLLAGLGLFGLGVRSLVRAIKPVPFETQVKDIRAMVAGGKYVAAVNQINAIGNFYKDRSQQAELQWLAGDALYLAQTRQGGTAGYALAADHYRKAETLGALPTILMHERWGLAALKAGDLKLGIEKLELAAKDAPAKWIEHAREFVAAYVAAGDIPKAQAVIDRVLASQDQNVGVDDRAWGYAKKIELALMERRAGESDADLDAALTAARQAAVGMPERDPSGRLLVWIGRAEFEDAKLDLSREHLEAARKKFIVHHLDDGRAAVLLGQIALAQDRLADAQKLFQETVMGQAGTPVWAAARLGRAEVLAKQDQSDAAMEADYRFVIKTLQDEADAANQSKTDGRAPAELVNIDQVRADLTAEYQHYEEQDKQADALKFLGLLKEIKDKETPAMALAWAVTREHRAQQLLAADQAHPKQPAAGSREEAQKLLKASAEDYLRHSQMTTMNDTVSGDSLWKAAQLFDQAGETMRSIERFEQFTRARPSDPRVPEALLATGRLYQSAGMIDKAILAYQQNIKENPTTPAAYASAVNLARCYMNSSAGTADERFKNAEKTLLSLVQDNVNLLPTANEYRVSLFTLGELYYRNNMWADAILRFQEAIDRYPDDKGIPRATFMLAESFRHSALDIGEALKTEIAGEHRAALIDARQRRLEQAGELFGKVIAMLDTDPESAAASTPPLSSLEDETLRASYMDRAECSYLLKDYAGAIRFYDAAATRFSQDATSAEAYVQIVNAYHALGAPAQASAAAERGRWALRQIPDAAFGKGPVPLSRQYYEDLLKLAREN